MEPAGAGAPAARASAEVGTPRRTSKRRRTESAAARSAGEAAEPARQPTAPATTTAAAASTPAPPPLPAVELAECQRALAEWAALCPQPAIGVQESIQSALRRTINACSQEPFVTPRSQFQPNFRKIYAFLGHLFRDEKDEALAAPELDTAEQFIVVRLIQDLRGWIAGTALERQRQHLGNFPGMLPQREAVLETKAELRSMNPLLIPSSLLNPFTKAAGHQTRRRARVAPTPAPVVPSAGAGGGARRARPTAATAGGQTAVASSSGSGQATAPQPASASSGQATVAPSSGSGGEPAAASASGSQGAAAAMGGAGSGTRTA